jgi:hypothetical protein
MSKTFKDQIKYNIRRLDWSVKRKTHDPLYISHDNFRMYAGKRRKLFAHRANKSFRLSWRKSLKDDTYENMRTKARDISWDLW